MCRALKGIDFDHRAKTNVIQYLALLSQPTGKEVLLIIRQGSPAFRNAFFLNKENIMFRWFFFFPTHSLFWFGSITCFSNLNTFGFTWNGSRSYTLIPHYTCSDSKEQNYGQFTSPWPLVNMKPAVLSPSEPEWKSGPTGHLTLKWNIMTCCRAVWAVWSWGMLGGH